jgi:cell division protein FtsN
MSYLSKSILIATLIFSVSFTACKEEKKATEKKATTSKVVKKKETPKPVAKKVTPKKEEKKPVVKKAPNKYFLIVASFQERTNAERMQDKLNTEGFKAEVHDAPNGFFRVSYKGFSNRKLAFEELKNVRSTEQHQDTWLYIKR